MIRDLTSAFPNQTFPVPVATVYLVQNTIGDIVFEIMSYLPHVECEKLGLVCKSFHQISENSPVYHYLFQKFELEKPNEGSYKKFLCDEKQGKNPNVLLARGYLRCDYLYSKEKCQEVFDVIQKLVKFGFNLEFNQELSEKQQLELIFLKGDLFNVGEAYVKDEHWSHLRGALTDFAKSIRNEEPEKKYNNKKTWAEAFCYFPLVKDSGSECWDFSEIEIQFQNLLIDKRHRVLLRYQSIFGDCINSPDFSTSIDLLKTISRDPATCTNHRIEAILKLGEYFVSGLTDAITPQEMSDLVASVYNYKAVPIYSRLQAKTLQGILYYQFRVVNKTTLLQWFKDIEVMSAEYFNPSVARLFQLIIQLADKPIDATTQKELEELYSKDTPIGLVAGLYLAILHYENRIVFEGAYSFLQLFKDLIVEERWKRQNVLFPNNILLKAKLYLVLLHEKDPQLQHLSYSLRYAYLKEVSESAFADPKDALMAKLHMVLMHEKEPICILSLEKQYAFLNEVLESHLLDETCKTEALRLKAELNAQTYQNFI